MSYEVKEKVVRVDHAAGCSRNKSCGPECVRVTEGWVVEYRLALPGRRRPARKRERIPPEWSESKTKRNAWARTREAFWLTKGQEGENERASMTVAQLAESWIRQRKAEGCDVVKDEQRFRDHVNPVLGRLPVVEVRPRHAHELVMNLRRTPSTRGGVLSSRTVRSIYFQTKQLFTHAVLQELVSGNPILVGRGVLPKKEDKDPGWRKGAIFTVDEVEQLISSPEVPGHRRVVYALSFLTGLRPGQVNELRWGDYDPSLSPLGRLSSSRSWDSKHKRVKSTKTSVDHLVPVHPTLAKILAEWKLLGWRERHGRTPKDEDLIVPTINLTNRDVRKALEDFLEDLKRLHLRKRRQYDARRTFMSLALSGGAPKDLVRWITHPRPADVFDLYVTPSWEALCAAVERIVVKRRGEGAVGLLENGTQMARDEARQGRNEKGPEARKLRGPMSGGV